MKEMPGNGVVGNDAHYFAIFYAKHNMSKECASCRNLPIAGISNTIIEENTL